MKTLIFLLVLTLSCPTFSKIYVVTNADAPITNLSKKELRDLYLGRTKSFPNGEYAKVIDRQGNEELRTKFFKTVCNMSPRKVDAFWAKLVFSGRMHPLEKMEADAEVLNSLKDDKYALAFVSSAPVHANLKIVMVIE